MLIKIIKKRSSPSSFKGTPATMVLKLVFSAIDQLDLIRDRLSHEHLTTGHRRSSPFYPCSSGTGLGFKNRICSRLYKIGTA